MGLKTVSALAAVHEGPVTNLDFSELGYKFATHGAGEDEVKKAVGAILSTHPSAEDRAAALRALVPAKNKAYDARCRDADGKLRAAFADEARRRTTFQGGVPPSVSIRRSK